MKKLEELTREKLITLYRKEKRSLEDLGKIYGVSRVAVYKKLKKFNIRQRSKSQARLEAQKQGKLPQQYFKINVNFFRKWSPEMAYVLGLIITDGCVSKGSVSLCLNDRELLEKVRQVMSSGHKITPSKHQKGLYIFRFAREKLIKDLDRLNVVPQKSLKVKFPQIPQDYLPSFIRGVFDGDGSVYFDMRSKNCLVRSKFCSGSKDFIVRLENGLQSLGLPRRNIYEQKTKNGVYYMFRYGHNDSKNLFDILYKNAQNGLFLERKYKKFLEGFQKEQESGKRASGMA